MLCNEILPVPQYTGNGILTFCVLRISFQTDYVEEFQKYKRLKDLVTSNPETQIFIKREGEWKLEWKWESGKPNVTDMLMYM